MPFPADHRRTHNLLLLSRLLSLRDNASPFTLLLDSLSQSAAPLVTEYISRAAAAKLTTLYVSFGTAPYMPSNNNMTIIGARGLGLQQLSQKISAALSSAGAGKKALIILSPLNPLCTTHPAEVPQFLSSLLSPTTSLLGVFHTDVPAAAAASEKAYPDTAPAPLTLLNYFATTVITLHSFAHVLQEKEARDRSAAPPAFGLDEGVDGVLVGLGANSPGGLVLELEYRRKSGRGVREWYFLGEAVMSKLPGGAEEKMVLLEEHPAWRVEEKVVDGAEEEKGPESTFELGLTERQKRAREEVVLPYFDAQRESGIGGGGMILFTPDREIDDFDDEEDEI
ncbi:Elongator complex protein 5 [Sphaerosporella brunnea]|uniref:Elongator complex protein 5 n=1 Tax=Sphaerosporella brunnea TaxID=1250544 RepID=A0A5J5F4R8_9PEZI|nr:Elongator complex protein 5 [Sphaerosporella brunnea]